MADEINVGRLVAEIVLEAETEKAKQEVTESAKNIQKAIKTIENTNVQVNVDVKQAEEQVKKSTENIKSTMVNINGRLVPVTLGVETDKANEQIKNSAENIKSTINKLNSETVQVPCKINWEKIESEWAQGEQWIAERAQNIQIPVAVNIEETSTDMMLKKIRERLRDLGLEASEVEKIIQGSFSDLSAYSNYEKQLSIIAAKLEVQRRKVEELRKEQEQLSNSKLITTTQIKNAEKVTKAYESESFKLKQLEIQYDRINATQENYVDKKVAVYQKGVAVAEEAAAKEIASQQKLQAKMDKSNTALIFADLTTSLRTFNTVSPGVIYNIGTIVRQLNLLRRASQSGASTGIIAATSVLAVLGTVATLAVGYLNSIKEKQEDARKKAVGLAEEYKDTSQSIKELTAEYVNLKNTLDISVLSVTDQAEAKNQLYNIEKQLIEIFGDEAAGLDLVNGKIDEQIAGIQELNRVQAIQHTAENYNAYVEAQKNLEKEIEFTFSDYSIDSVKMKKMIEGRFPNSTVFEGESIILHIKTEDAIDELTDFYDFVYKNHDQFNSAFFEIMRKDISKEINKLDTEKIKEDIATVEQYDYALDVINGKVEESAEEQAEHFSNLFSLITQNVDALENMASAYEKLNSGEQLDSSALLELCDTYPELAKYIAETGDLSLENGDKIVEAQEKVLLSNISTLASEKALLEAKTNRTDDEEKQLNSISAALDIYQSKLREIYSTDTKIEPIEISDFQTAVSNLSSAYETLSDGKELDFEQTLNLIDKYPELAQKLSDGTSSIDEQKEAIKELYEAKKEEMLLSLQADQTELQSLISTNNTTIQALQTRMQTYSMVASVVTDCKMQIAELESENTDYNNRLTQTEAKIAAINNLYVETGSTTDETNSKLQEQLNLINHRKAMNNLTYGEEISWLQLLYTEYATNAEERMSLDEKIYTAQQNLIKEQEQAYSDLYNTEIKNLEHLKALDQLSKEQELTWLNTIYSAYVLTAEERMSLEEKIYSVQKEIQNEQEQAIKDAMQAELDLLEHEKSMDRLSAEDEIKWLERIDSQYEMSIEDRRSMELKLYNARKSYEEEIQKNQQETLDKAIEALEKRRSTSRITYEEEIKQLREIYRTYNLTIEQQQQVLEQIRSLSSSAKSERSNQFGTLGDGVVEALKNQYQQQRDLEEERINESIESWQKWEDETVNSIQSQIDDLDKLSDAQESEKERQEYENKRQATELQLAYEKDDYNRKQLQKELARLDNEENERLAEEQRKQQKEELQAQINSVKEQSQAQQDLLQAELDAVAENYDKLMSSYSLENEAYKMMLSKSQSEIISFIGSYAPEYELLGQTLGEKLYIGLKNKISNIDYYFQQLQVNWQFYSNRTAAVANQAVDQFWASRAEYESKINSVSTPSVNLTVNFNEQVESPVEVARKMKQVTQNLVTQLKQ